MILSKKQTKEKEQHSRDTCPAALWQQTSHNKSPGAGLCIQMFQKSKSQKTQNPRCGPSHHIAFFFTEVLEEHEGLRS